MEQALIDLTGSHDILDDAHEVTKGQAQILEGDVQDLRTDLEKEVTARSTKDTQLTTSISNLESSRALKNDLNSANAKISSLQSIVNSLIAGGKHQSSPLTTCRNLPSTSPSGVYWIKPNSRVAFQVYCDQDVGGGWMLQYRFVSCGVEVANHSASFYHKSGSNTGLSLYREPLKYHDYTARRRMADRAMYGRSHPKTCSCD